MRRQGYRLLLVSLTFLRHRRRWFVWFFPLLDEIRTSGWCDIRVLPAASLPHCSLRVMHAATYLPFLRTGWACFCEGRP
jgi:hypothetical protein